MLTEILLIVATTITAVATSVTAYVGWRRFAGKVSANWDFTWTGKEDNRFLSIRCEIYNRKDVVLRALSIEVVKPAVISVDTGSPRKHESWADNRAPISADIDPDGKWAFGAHVHFDWQTLSANPPKRLVTRSALDTPLRVQIELVCKSARRQKIRLSSQVMMPKRMIDNMAAKGKA